MQNQLPAKRAQKAVILHTFRYFLSPKLILFPSDPAGESKRCVLYCGYIFWCKISSIHSRSCSGSTFQNAKQQPEQAAKSCMTCHPPYPYISYPLSQASGLWRHNNVSFRSCWILSISRTALTWEFLDSRRLQNYMYACVCILQGILIESPDGPWHRKFDCSSF